MKVTRSYYSCYDLKQSSKVNLSVYFLPADGWEKVIKIRRFLNETAILSRKTFYVSANLYVRGALLWMRILKNCCQKKILLKKL
ncbi:MAG: hypothetical protein LBR79_05450 [Oscillospiraceae bacterium]|nr:hypothetical protein [Oscillospiraceae bacterium]